MTDNTYVGSHSDLLKIFLMIEDASSSFFDSPLPDMEFLEVLTEGLNRVLLVRGGGREVITIYS